MSACCSSRTFVSLAILAALSPSALAASFAKSASLVQRDSGAPSLTPDIVVEEAVGRDQLAAGSHPAVVPFYNLKVADDAKRIGAKKHEFEPASFNSTQAQDSGDCKQPFLAANSMYLTATGASLWTGQWGKWRLSEDPDSIATSSWRVNFLQSDWQTLHINSDSGKLAVVVKPMSDEELRESHNWVAQDIGGKWDFMTELFAPAMALYYDSRNYSIKQTGRHRLSAQPDAKGIAFGRGAWETWAVMDCKDGLVAVLKLEKTLGLRPGRTIIYNKKGVKAADTLPDTTVDRVQFIDVNHHLMATAEAPNLNANVAMEAMPRRRELGMVLPYTVHFELGPYELSSDLLKPEMRWIIGAAVQVRALQDAHADFVPPLVDDRWLLLSIFLAVLLMVLLLVFLALNGTSSSIRALFTTPSRPKTMQPPLGFHAAPSP